MNDRYLKYDALELAQDEGFIRWVKGESTPGPREWEEWLARHPEKQQAAEQARLLVQSIIIREAPVSRERIDNAWKKIDAACEEAPARVAAPRLRVYRLLGYAAAAILALLLAFFFLRPDGAVTIEAGYGQIAEHSLPDGSAVQLNAGTSISYHEGRWTDERRVSMAGEAFFEVEKGRPFVVETAMGKVEVLGTSFNIKTFEGHFDVKCYTGKVQVSANGRQEILTAGQQAKWAEKEWQKAAFDPTNSPGWRSGRFEYHSAPLRQVFAEMERQFDVQINAPDSILGRTYTGAYERNSLDSALYRVCWPMSLKASRKGKAVAILQAATNGK